MGSIARAQISVLLCAAATLLQAAGNEYADARVCARCHRQIDESYRLTGMGRSMFRPAPSNTIEDYTKKREFYHSLSDTHYSMEARNGTYYQRRWQIGPDNKETNIEEMKIDLVMGSGNHARSYLHRIPSQREGGAFIELPLGWYAEKGGYWGMSPGFDSRHPLTRRFASYECVYCHDGYPKIPAGSDAPGSEPVFTGDLPEGIDCQRCHGPGGRHVRTAQTAGAKIGDIRQSIVNPARLNAKLRMDVCLQCHLEPTSGRLPSLIRRFNRGPFSFIPGEPLEAFILVFDHARGAGRDDKFEIVGSSAYRLRQSQCFLKSKGAMTCETCHDPHRVPRGEEAVRYYSGACRQCHASALDTLISSGKHPAGVNCAACHMPKRRTDDVVHAVMTDHLIQRRPPDRDLLVELTESHPTEAGEYHGPVVPYYPATLSDTGEDGLYKAVAQVAGKSNTDEGLAALSREVAKQQPREPEFYMVLGDAFESRAKHQDAAAAYEKAIRLKPDLTRGWSSLASAWLALGQTDRSADAVKRGLQVSPSDAGLWYQSAVLDSGKGRATEALDEVRRAIALNAESPAFYTALAGILTGAGQNDGAEAALRTALRIDPYDATACDLTGRGVAGRGDFAGSLYYFEKAIQLRPDYGPHLYDYGLVLVQLNRVEEAQKALESAVRADPNLPEGHWLLGTLLARKRQFAESASEYREAIRLRRDFGRARLDLASALAAQGDMAGAVDQLREAAKDRDPQIAQQATRALERVGSR